MIERNLVYDWEHKCLLPEKCWLMGERVMWGASGQFNDRHPGDHTHIFAKGDTICLGTEKESVRDKVTFMFRDPLERDSDTDYGHEWSHILDINILIASAEFKSKVPPLRSSDKMLWFDGDETIFLENGRGRNLQFRSRTLDEGSHPTEYRGLEISFVHLNEVFELDFRIALQLRIGWAIIDPKVAGTTDKKIAPRASDNISVGGANLTGLWNVRRG